MFTSIVADLLTRILGDYITLDPTALKISIWAGDVVLHNLELKSSAFDKFNLPYTVKAGYIGLLRLKLNWKNLKSSEAIVEIDRIYAILSPNKSIVSSSASQSIQDWELKKKKIEAIELQQALQDSAKSSLPASSDDPGFMEKLISAIINNLTVNITRIHLRIEDHSNIVCGVLLDSLSVISVNKEGKGVKAAGEPVGGQIFKFMQVKGFGIYCNTDDKLDYIDCTNKETFISGMDKFFMPTNSNTATPDMPSSLSPPITNYILEQGVYSMHFCLNQNRKTSSSSKLPVSVMKIDMGTLRVKLYQRQYQEIIELISSTSNYSAFNQFKIFRPLETISSNKSRSNIKKWWQYALECLKIDIKMEIKKKSILWTSKLIAIRKKYIVIYNKMKERMEAGKTLSNEEMETLWSFEKQLTLDQIFYFRKIAGINVVGISESNSPAKSTSWFSGYLPWSSSSSTSGSSSATYVLSNVEKQKLYESIEYTPGSADSTLVWNTLNDKDVIISIKFSIKDTEIVLINQRGAEIISIGVHSLLLDVDSYQKNLYLNFNIQDVFVRDLFQQGDTQFPLLIKKQQSGRNPKFFLNNLSDGGLKPRIETENDLINLKIKSPPLDTVGVGLSVFAEGKGIDIVVNMPTFLEVSNFFILPEIKGVSKLKDETWEALLKMKDSSGNNNNSSNSTSVPQTSSLRTILDIYIEAPSIILPLDVLNPNCSIVLINLGSLKVDSGSGSSSSKASLYEEYNIHVKNIYLLLTTNAIWKKNQDSYNMFGRKALHDYLGKTLRSNNNDQHIIYPVNINVKVSNCLDLNNFKLPALILDVNFKPVLAKITPSKALSLFDAVNSVMNTLNDYFPAPLPNNSGDKIDFKKYIAWKVRCICHICRKGFASENALESHLMFKHHGKSKERIGGGLLVDESGIERYNATTLTNEEKLLLQSRVLMLASIALDKISFEISNDDENVINSATSSPMYSTPPSSPPSGSSNYNNNISANTLITLEFNDFNAFMTQKSLESTISISLTDFVILDNFRKSKVRRSNAWEDKYLIASQFVTSTTMSPKSSPFNSGKFNDQDNGKLVTVLIETFSAIEIANSIDRSGDDENDSIDSKESVTKDKDMNASTVITVEFDSLTLCINPETIAAIIRLADNVGNKINEKIKNIKEKDATLFIVGSKRQTVVSNNSRHLAADGGTAESYHSTDGNALINNNEYKPNLSIKASIKCLAIVLNTIDDGPFYHMAIELLHAQIISSSKFQLYTGYVGTISLVDNFIDKRYRNILRHAELVNGGDNMMHDENWDPNTSSMISFNIKLYQSDLSETSSINIVLKKPRIIGLYKTFDNLKMYFTTGAIFEAINEDDAAVTQQTLAAFEEVNQKLIEQANEFAIKTGDALLNSVGNVDNMNKLSQTFPLINIEIIDPMVIVPQSSISNNLAISRFERLSLSNDINDLASLEIKLQDFNIYTNILLKDSNKPFTNMNQDVDATFFSSYSSSANASPLSPTLNPSTHSVIHSTSTAQGLLGNVNFFLSVSINDVIEINIEMPLLKMCCSQTQLGFLVSLPTENFVEASHAFTTRTKYDREKLNNYKEVDDGLGEDVGKEISSIDDIAKIAAAKSFTPISLKLNFIGATLELVYGDAGYDVIYFNTSTYYRSASSNSISEAGINGGDIYFGNRYSVAKNKSSISPIPFTKGNFSKLHSSKSGSVHHDGFPPVILAKLEIDKISVNLVVREEKELVLDLNLQKFLIHDNRGLDSVLPNHSETLQFVKNRNEAALNVQVKLRQDNLEIFVEIAGLKFLASNLLFAIIDWIQLPLISKESSTLLKDGNTVIIRSTNNSPTKSKNERKKNVNKKNETSFPLDITIKLKLDDFNFYILASPLDPQSSALVISFGAHVDLNMSKKLIFDSNVAIDYLRGCRCASDLIPPKQDMADFCQTFSINAILNECDINELKFNIFLKSNNVLNLRLSRRDFFILMEGIKNIMESSSSSGKENKQEGEEKKEDINYEVYNSSPLQQQNLLEKKIINKNSGVNNNSRKKNLVEALRGNKLSIEIPGIQVTIINDSAEVFTPILIGSVKNLIFWVGTEPSSVVHINSRVDLSFYYYNATVSYWEPLLEPLGIELSGTSQIAVCENKRESKISLPSDEGFKFQLSTRKELNFNVSIAFLNSIIIALSQVFLADASSEVVFSNDNLGSGYYIKLRNVTGKDLKYSVTSRNVRIGEENDILWFPSTSGSCVNTTIPAHRLYVSELLSVEEAYNDEKSVLLIHFENYPIIKIRTSKHGTFPITMTNSRDGTSCCLLVDISAEIGSKVVSLKSGFELVNELNYQVEIKYKTNMESIDVTTVLLNQGESYFLPMIITPQSFLFFKPIIAEDISCKVYSRHFLLNELSKSNAIQSNFFSEIIEFNSFDVPFMEPLFILLDVIKETPSSLCAFLRYPVIIENLLPVPLQMGLVEINQTSGASNLLTEQGIRTGEAIGIGCISSMTILDKLSIVTKVDYAGVRWSRSTSQTMFAFTSDDIYIDMFDDNNRRLRLQVELVRISEVEASYGVKYSSNIESIHRMARKKKDTSGEGGKLKKKNPLLATDKKNQTLYTTKSYERKSSSSALLLRIYAPYWIINHTTYPLKFGSLTGFRPPQDDLMTTICDANGRRVPLLLASFPDEESKLLVQYKDNAWSTPFSINVIGTDGMLEVESNNEEHGTSSEERCLELSVSIKAGPNRMFRSRIITVNPRFIIVNKIGYSIQLKQLRSKKEYILADGESTALLEWVRGSSGFGKISIRPHYNDIKDDNDINKDKRNEWLYSQGFSIDQLGELCIQMVNISMELSRFYALPGNAKDMHQSIAIVQIRSVNGSVTVTLFPPRKDEESSSKSLLPYRIDNYCNDKVVTVYQSGTRPSMGHVVNPHSSVPFIWFNPNAPKTVDIILKPLDIIRELKGGDIEMLTPPHALSLDQLGNLASIETDSEYSTIRFLVVLDGDQKVLIITDALPPPDDEDFFSPSVLTHYAIRRMANVKVQLAELSENLAKAEENLSILNQKACVKQRNRDDGDRLWLHVLSARDLAGIGTPEDVFYGVVIEHDGVTFKTKMVSSSGTPVWNQYFEIPIDANSNNRIDMHFDILSQTNYWSETTFGNCDFSSTFKMNKCYDVWLPIFDGEKGSGEIRIKMIRTKNFAYTKLLDTIKATKEAILSARQLQLDLQLVIGQYEEYLEASSEESKLPTELSLYLFTTTSIDIAQEVPLNSFEISLKQVGLSLIDGKPRELMYFSLQNIFIDITLCKSGKKAFVLVIESLQLDDGSEDSVIPTLLYITEKERQLNNNSKEKLPPAIQLSILERPTPGHYQYFSLLMQEIDFIIPQKWLFRLLKMIREIQMAKIQEAQHDGADDTSILLTFNDFSSAEEEACINNEMDISSRLMFDKLELHPVALNITYFQGESEKSLGSGLLPEVGFSSVKAVLDLTGSIIKNLNHAPLHFNAFVCENVIESTQQLMERLKQHYLRQALLGSYRLLGNAANDFLGDPVGLVNNLGTGVKDFFYEPAIGLLSSPADFGKGLSKGTSSLIGKTAFGVSSTASTLTQGLSIGISNLSLDADYKKERKLRKEMIQEGKQKANILSGMSSFGNNILGGVSGVFTQPIRGAQEGGVGGAIRGVGKGVLGLFVKPVVGASDLIGDTLIGIQNVSNEEKKHSTKESKLKKVRPSRLWIEEGKVLIEYKPKKKE